jgi:hypothetical protein
MILTNDKILAKVNLSVFRVYKKHEILSCMFPKKFNKIDS